MWSQVNKDVNKVCAENNQIRRFALELIMKGKSPGRDFIRVKDMDIYSKRIKIELGMRFMILMYLISSLNRRNKWIEGTVESIDDNLLKFSYNDGQDKVWMEVDSDNISVPSTKLDSMRKREMEMLMEYNDLW